MKSYQTKDIRNVALLGHSGCGKTTFAECMLYEAGVINRRGRVEDGNTVSDHTNIERERGNSVFSSILYAPWKDCKINIIDTPGFDDFVGEVASAMKVADTAIMMLNAQNGVEVGTELLWSYVKQFKSPTVFVVNHIDHEKADFDKTVEQAKERFGNNVLVVQYPLNQGKGFNAIVDVLKMVVYEFPADGGKPEKKEIPESEIGRAQELHNALVEAAAENDESLMEKFFDAGTLNEEEMVEGLRIGLSKQVCFPLFVSSAEHNMGSGRVMGFIHDIAPSPADNPPAKLADGGELVCSKDDDTSLFIFKTLSEPNVGNLSYFKVYAGELKANDELVNTSNSSSERFNQFYVAHGKHRENVNSLIAGDIGVTVKLKNSHTNNTLNTKGVERRIAEIPFPQPRIRTAVVPPSKAEIDKMSQALHQLHEEDPTLLVEHSQELSQVILHGQGELHLELCKYKISKVYGIDIEFERPRIPYRETIQREARSNYRHKKQSGGSGQFAEVHMLIEPYYEGMPDPDGLNVRKVEEKELKWGGKLVFNNCIVGGSIDAKFMPSILKGVMQKMQEGPLTGSYCRDIRVSVYDGKMHPVDSNDMAFQIAGAMAFKNCFHEASPQIMEPIYDIDVLVPEDMMGDVMSDLQSRRAIITGMEADGHYQHIKAKVPLSELYKYSSTLRSLTHGLAKHTREFAEYGVVPHDVQERLMADYIQEELAEA